MLMLRILNNLRCNTWNVKSWSQIQAAGFRYATTKSIEDTVNWTPLYRLPAIRFAAALSKIKLYQMGLTAAGIPATFALETASNLPEGSTLIFGSIGVTGMLTLFLASMVTENLIGFIYINDTNDRIKLSIIDFWGRRKATEMQIEDIVHPSQLPKMRLDVWTPIYTVNNPGLKLKLLHRYGEVIEKEKFVTLFGE